MSRKHYRALAEALKVSGAEPAVIREVAKVLAADNPRFDWGIFYKACGLTVLA